MHCNKVLFQELLDCFDNDFENNLENNTDSLEHNAEKLQEILNRIMQRIMSIITSALITNLSATLIDHVLTSPPLNVIKCYQAVGLSDHRSQIIEVGIAIMKSVPRQVTVCSFCKYPWDKVKEALCTAPWQVMEIYDDMNDMWTFFISILHECLNAYVPLHATVSKCSSCHTPWITPFLLSVTSKCTCPVVQGVGHIAKCMMSPKLVNT